jgi:tetratricopeptide (TPR) repeat protein
MKNFLTSALLLSAFSVAFSALLCPAWAKSEPPKLTPAAQKAVYEAQQAMNNKDFLKAEQFLKRYIRKYPQKPHYLVEFTLGNILAMTDKESEALSHYKTAADLYPDYAAVWQNMGKILFDLKQYEKAGNCLLKAYELDEKKDPSALYNVAVIYIVAGKEKKALRHLEYLSSGEMGPPKQAWLEALLKVCVDLQLKERALGVIQKLLAEDGNDPRWWKLLAQFHLQESDYKKAVTALTIHSYLASISREDLVLLGDLTNAIGIPLKAAEYYEKALRLSNSPAVYEKIAAAYIAAHKMANAIDALNRALKEEPTSNLWFMMGQVLYEAEEYEKALNAFDKSAQLNPKDGRPHLMMGYCALHMDRNETAEKALKKAIRFPKQREMAKRMLSRLALWNGKSGS